MDLIYGHDGHLILERTERRNEKVERLCGKQKKTHHRTDGFQSQNQHSRLIEDIFLLSLSLSATALNP